MINFEKLEAVEKTWTRTGGATREAEEYEGLRLRCYMSNKGKIKAEKEGKTFEPFKEIEFQFSPKYFTSLGLDTLGMKHFRNKDDNNKVVLLVVDSEQAKFLRNKTDKDGNTIEKGNKFVNSLLLNDLVASGLIPQDPMGYFYFKMVKEEIAGAPDWVKAGYVVEFDKSEVTKGEVEADEVVQATENVDTPVNGPVSGGSVGGQSVESVQEGTQAPEVDNDSMFIDEEADGGDVEAQDDDDEFMIQ